MNDFLKTSSNRVQWVDIAKGITIIFVIIGHTIPYGDLRNFIFSFHMPLFFILSGFTFKAPCSINVIPNRIIKNIRLLLLPSILASVVVILGYWLQSGNYTVNELSVLAIKMIDAWWWASGVEINNHPGLGALWFLITLFWIRVIVDIISVLVKVKYECIIFIFLFVIGMVLGKLRIWLPQNMDVTLVAIIFFYVGIQWKRYEDWISRNSMCILLLSFLLWGICLYKGIFIELATRHYPKNIISIIEAIGATYIVCTICKYIVVIKKVEGIFSFIGMHTLTIFIVHHLDQFVSCYWINNSLIVMNIYRVCIVLAISLVIYCGRTIYKSMNY